MTLSRFCVGTEHQQRSDAFLHAEHVQGRDWDFSEAQIVLTVPASFDEVARSLTAEAAKAAGLGDVTLGGILSDRIEQGDFIEARGRQWLVEAVDNRSRA